MVGLVIVSHSQGLAEAIVEMCHAMSPDAPMRAAGGMEDGTMGTSYEKIENAISELLCDDGVLVLMDMGSSVMTTELVLEDLEDNRVEIVDCPVVEGALVASVMAESGYKAEEIIAAAKDAGTTPKF